LNPSTSSAAATHASHSATPGNGEARPIPGIFGRTSGTPFAFYDLDGRCWRTFQATLPWASDEYSETWSNSGTALNGTASRRPMSVPRIFATGSSSSPRGPNSDGLWPTPAASESNWDQRVPYAQGGMPLGMAVDMWPTPMAHQGPAWNRSGGPSLPAAVLFPTPLAREWKDPTWSGFRSLALEVLLPTPLARDWKDTGPKLRFSDRRRLGIVVAKQNWADGGRLNPTWVEWLMGFPLGWTDLDHSGTPSSHKSPS